MVDENRKGEFYDLEKNSKKCMCVLCECDDPKAHVSYWECPIFKNEKICAPCCTIETLRSGVEEKYSKSLGRKITREEINKFCGDCGRNHACENNELADRLTFDDSFTKIEEEESIPEEKKNEENKDKKES